MNNFKSHFRFNKQERSGIFFLLLIIVLLQVGYFFYGSFSADAKEDTLVVDFETQAQIDKLKQAALQKDAVKIYPFNPNFITDHKGYTLGMSVDEIDRLHAFRKQNKFANTSEEWQKVTKVSDSLLNAISTYFKFPEWTKTNTKSAGRSTQNGRGGGTYKKASPYGVGVGEDAENAVVGDLNSATAEELRKISGIGEKLSARILKFRDRLGGFVVDEQLYDVYGLKPEVVDGALQKFKVLQKPNIQKININTASAQEIGNLVYIQKQVANSIVNYRNDKNGIVSLDELENIEGFPFEKIDRIALYLSL